MIIDSIKNGQTLKIVDSGRKAKKISVELIYETMSILKREGSKT